MAKKNNNKAVIANLQKQVRDIDDAIVIGAMTRLGDQALDDIIRGHIWKNRTFNLEDSIGYAVYAHGVKVRERFLNDEEKATAGKVLHWKSSTENGTEFKGRDEAKRLIDDYEFKNYGLIVVAGMFYAAWLEALHGLDVLTNAYQVTKDNVNDELKDIATFYTNKKI